MFYNVFLTELCLYIYLASISSIVSNVWFDPLESQVLVPKTHIPRYDVITRRHETQSSQTIVESHNNLKSKYQFSL